MSASSGLVLAQAGVNQKALNKTFVIDSQMPVRVEEQPMMQSFDGIQRLESQKSSSVSESSRGTVGARVMDFLEIDQRS